MGNLANESAGSFAIGVVLLLRAADSILDQRSVNTVLRGVAMVYSRDADTSVLQFVGEEFKLFEALYLKVVKPCASERRGLYFCVPMLSIENF